MFAVKAFFAIMLGLAAGFVVYEIYIALTP